MLTVLSFLPLCFASAQQDMLFEYRTGHGQGLWTGESVAASDAGDVNGDGFDDFIVGLSFWDSPIHDAAGAARIFSGADGSMLHQLFGDEDTEWFGHAVAAAGDVDGDGFDDFIIGAPNDGFGGQSNGSASVYSGATGVLIHRFTGQNGYPHGAYMGWSVSGVGDLNADGYADVLVGSPWASPNSLDLAGSAHVYSGVDGSVIYEYHGTSPWTYLGGCVSGIADIDADGVPDFIVGAPFSSPAITSGGGAKVYSGATGNLIHQIDGQMPEGMLATSIADVGDVDADGTPDFLLGGPGGWQTVGHAIVYSGATGGPIFDLSSGVVGDLFGTSVAGIGDVNADGHADFMVGAPFSDAFGLSSTGAAYLYSGVDGSRLQKISGDANRMYLGTALSNAGDVNNDGRDDLIIAGATSGPTYFVWVLDVRPFLTTSAESVSASLGGTIDFGLELPVSEAGRPYRLLASRSGVGPTALAGIEIPLTVDPLLLLMLQNPPPYFTGLTGNLDAQGKASATMVLPAGVANAFAGSTVHFAASSLSLAGRPIVASWPAAVEVLP